MYIKNKFRYIDVNKEIFQYCELNTILLLKSQFIRQIIIQNNF